MRSYSLYSVLFASLTLVGLVFAFSLYLSIKNQRSELIATAVQEKIRLAEVIDGTIFSETWRFRLGTLPGLEDVFLSKTAQFQDIIFLRIVADDNTIRRSSIPGESGKPLEASAILLESSGQQVAVEDTTYQGEDIKLVIYPSVSGQTIWVGFSLKSIQQALARSTIQNAVLGFSVLFLLLIVLYLVFRSIIDPLKKLTIASQKIAKGALGTKVDVKVKTEIGELAQAFNEMTQDLKESHAALEEAKKVLEVKVKARTRELENLTQTQEEIIKSRTQEIQEKMKELERFNKLAIGRELKMVELKKKLQQAEAVRERLKKKMEGNR